MKTGMFMLIVMATLSLSACGGGSGTPMTPPPPVAYTIGGTVSGLSGTGLVLQDNGSNNLPVGANGAFTFTTSIASGGGYSVTVLTQPSSPAQNCTVTSGSGMANANVTSIQVACVGQAEWAWMNGADVVNQIGSYGTLGTPAPSNVPGARLHSVSWTTASGDLWLFGGNGFALPLGVGLLNDLWKFSAGEWTWMSGSDTYVLQGSYGTLGTPSPTNTPGPRQSAVTWTDASGNLLLFGGYGYDSAQQKGELNDMWEFSAGEWTWMSGSNVYNQPGVYGNLGTPSPSNVPGARDSFVGWTDAAGDLWLFGGYGLDSAGMSGLLNDLWKYSAGEWTWMGGSNLANQPATYGTQGVAAPGNVLGARQYALSWTDSAGNFWLFGGQSSSCQIQACGNLNDLWRYSAGEWTWMSGSNGIGQAGNYGTQGIAAPGNVPGARGGAVGWTDPAGNLWLFGGQGVDSTGFYGNLNDLWRYGAGQWTWMGGSNVSGQQGTYGSMGTPALGNVPGARFSAVTWTDASGNFWLFGGDALDSTGTNGYLNDLWKYEP